MTLLARRPTGQDGEHGSAPARQRLPWGALLVLGWLGNAALRLWLARDQTVPVATPDETGYLLGARVLTGGPDADLSASTVYRGGYALLVAPAYWISDDPGDVYRIAIAINAVVGATVLLLAYVLLRRLGLSRLWSYAGAHATALLPATVFYTQYVLADAVLPVLVLGWLLLLHSWLRDRNTWCGVAGVLVAAYIDATHVRGLIILGVSACVVGVVAVRGWLPRRSAGLVGAALAGGAVAGYLFNGWLAPQLYPRGGYDLQGSLVDRLTSLDGYGWILAVGTGQLWYLIVGTAGVAGVGLVALVYVAVRGGAEPRIRLLAAAVPVSVIGIAFATAAALPDEHRVGNYAYGRYLASLAPALFAVGIAVLLRSARRRAAALAAMAAAAGSALVIQVHAGDRLSTYTHMSFDFPEIAFLTWDWTALSLWPATIVAVALLGALVLAADVRPYGAALVAGLLVIVNLAANTLATQRISQPLAREAAAATDLRSAAGGRGTVAVDYNLPGRLRLPLLYQVGWTEIIGFNSNVWPPPDADLMVVYWHKGLPATASWRWAGGAPAGWRVVESRRSPEGDWVAWRRA